MHTVDEFEVKCRAWQAMSWSTEWPEEQDLAAMTA